MVPRVTAWVALPPGLVPLQETWVIAVAALLTTVYPCLRARSQPPKPGEPRDAEAQLQDTC